MSEKISIEDHITVGNLADKLGVPVTDLISELIKNGIMATLNDAIDFDTAQIIVGELGLDIELIKATEDEPKIKVKAPRTMVNPVSRPPVVAVMGHVDHGKTSLLDSIRGADVVSGEAGGITQHITAYQITHKGRVITFLDTPGHEAFASLRQHGAYLTDLVMLVVAADDGVKPQTLEAIKFARTANAPIMVAINKVDKPDANIPRVMQELADAGLMPEKWGGDTVVVEVSAKQKTNIDSLIDMAFLITDVAELTAEGEGEAEGIVIESHMEQGRGPVATVLVEHGKLKRGDYFHAGSSYGKVRTLEDYKGQSFVFAGPSTPAIITGLKELPRFGVNFKVEKTEKAAKHAASQYQSDLQGATLAVTSSELLAQIHKDRVSTVLPVIVKADVRGSVTSVTDGLNSLANSEVSLRVVGSGVGAINESDISMAVASKAIIYGFDVSVSSSIKSLARQHGVDIRVFKIIYELIDDAKAELEALLAPEIKETEIGRLVVKGVFKITKSDIICGGQVTKGKIYPGLLVRLGEAEDAPEAEVKSVQKSQQETKEVIEGEMCGLQLSIKQKTVIAEGDKLNFFTRELVKRTL